MLIVCAHEEEATFVDAVLRPEDDLVVTGPGKTLATLGLVTTLLALSGKERFHSRVLNLGLALPLVEDLREGVHVVTEIGQVDFDAEGVKRRTGRDVGRDVILPKRYDAHEMALASADYPPDDERKDHLAHAGYVLSDMEGYAYAAVCERLDLDFRCVKAVCGPYEDAVLSWVERTNTGSRMLAEWYEDNHG